MNYVPSKRFSIEVSTRWIDHRSIQSSIKHLQFTTNRGRPIQEILANVPINKHIGKAGIQVEMQQMLICILHGSPQVSDFKDSSCRLVVDTAPCRLVNRKKHVWVAWNLRCKSHGGKTVCWNCYVKTEKEVKNNINALQGHLFPDVYKPVHVTCSFKSSEFQTSLTMEFFCFCLCAFFIHTVGNESN